MQRDKAVTDKRVTASQGGTGMGTGETKDQSLSADVRENERTNDDVIDFCHLNQLPQVSGYVGG
jgi:hypothetical protein